MELLVPIKNKDAAFLAINLNADALYCSGPAFSARHEASISFSEIKEIIDYAHLYQKKVYITLNTLINEKDFINVIKYVDELIKLNIDALIIQDLGLLNYLNKYRSSLVLHASTQMHIHNRYGLALLEQYHFKKVVIPRELNLKQIKLLKEHSNIDLEVFIHGALCTSYSGQCYYSYLKGNGSGNHGSCQQECRKVHSINNSLEYSLSLKDLSIQESIIDLKDLANTFKIEGRLKSLTYLYSTTLFYQDLIKQNFYNNEMASLMQIAFNRTYTKGRLFNENGKQLLNKERINNNGLLIGNVVGMKKNKVTINID
ncbi:MAG: peptidase U32 family protein, partial [Bacilli bacterium]